MDFVDRMMGRSFAHINPNTLLKFSNLDAGTQRHLQKVYLTLACALAVTALGAYTDITFHVGGLLTFIVGFISMVWLTSMTASPSNLNTRYALLGTFAFTQGLSLGPLINTALLLHPSVIVTALLGTTAVFACFSAAALLTQRRSYLYLGGLLSSAVSLFMTMRFATWIFGGRALLFEAELYLGLLMFCGYVLFDTQVIVEKAANGVKDHVKDALSLFVDAIAIFVRVVVVLLRNAEKREAEQRNKRRRN